MVLRETKPRADAERPAERLCEAVHRHTDLRARTVVFCVQCTDSHETAEGHLSCTSQKSGGTR
jgi:hypothetical protein